MGYPDTEAEMEILTRQPRHGLLDRVQPVMDQNDLLTLQAEVDNIYMSEEILRYIVAVSYTHLSSSRKTKAIVPLRFQPMLRRKCRAMAQPRICLLYTSRCV